MERLKLKVAVYVFLIKDGKILLGRRMNCGWQDGNYGLPSGHLEPDESLVDGAIRELQEETGVIAKPEDIEFSHAMHRKMRYIDVFFKAKKWDGEPKIMEPNKCDDMQWFTLTNLPQNIVPSVKSAVEHLQKGTPFSEFEGKE